ncbi:hypothetical protein CYMTET_33048 [Cymbomonas tetramitiformis]|uniref:Uncharacterized protein n=1 Tax=Cymbomonas tetramitiformis TaxID=36881 RepID=A0AAE0FE77_9CHLO|nr:hypothetical protein CYMTET_33048 [Cymbomonas tetramitiformis]
MWQRLNGPGNVLGKRKCLRAFMGVARGVTSEKGEREGEEVEKEEGDGETDGAGGGEEGGRGDGLSGAVDSVGVVVVKVVVARGGE